MRKRRWAYSAAPWSSPNASATRMRKHAVASPLASAGGALAAIRLGRIDSALAVADALRIDMANEGDRWFQGREMVEALAVRAALETNDGRAAESGFRAALARAEPHDQYGAAWFV